MRFLTCLLLAGVLLVPATASANPPGNDHRKDAWTLTNGASGNTTEATRQSDIMVEGYRPGKGTHSVWWKWTAPQTGRLTITVNAPSFDSVVAAYTTWQEFNNGDVVSDADTGAGDTSSHIEIDAKAGQTFNIVVDGVTETAAGAYSFATTWDTTPPAPANDDLASAQTLKPAVNPLTDWTNFSHRYATKQAGEPMHRTQGAPNKSVWFKWTAPYNGAARVTVKCGDADLDSTNTVVAVYTGASVGSLTEVPYDKVAGGKCSFTQVRFKVLAGVTFRIAVDNVSADTGLTGVMLEFDTTPPKVTFYDHPVYGPQRPITFHDDAGYYEYVTYECKLDAQPAKTCTDVYQLGQGLTDGQHTLQVRATDDMGNVGPWAPKTFTYDKTPPETTFTSTPAHVIPDTKGATWHFASSEPGSTFTCQNGWWQSPSKCTSPYVIDYTATMGKHSLTVAAIDQAGNVDPTPAVFEFEAGSGPVTPKPVVPDTPKPVTPTTTTSKPVAPATTTSTTSTRSTATTPWAPVVPPRLLLRGTSFQRAALVKKGMQVALRCDQRVGCNAFVKLRLGRRVVGSVFVRRNGWHTLKLTKRGAALVKRRTTKRLVVAVGERAEQPVTIRIR